MLTGFQIRVPGGQKEGFDSKKPAQTATKPTRDGLGASTESIVADSSDDGNAVFSCLQSTVLVEICARNSLFSAQAALLHKSNLRRLTPTPSRGYATAAV